MILEVVLAALVACDPALTALFTPPHPELGSYEVCTTAEPIEVAAGPGADIEALEALDAFGTAGPYDRSKLARLYGGTRARVARRWRQTDGRLESTTFISPYPDASLERLLSGTMSIRWTGPALGAAAGPHPEDESTQWRHLPALIAMSPLTTSADITGSPLPIVVSPNRGPKASFIVSGMSEVRRPLNVTARMRAFAGRFEKRT
jgi:hypothetical protein